MSIVTLVESREVQFHQIAGKTVKAVSEDFGTCSCISFTDGTFLWLDADNSWRWHGRRIFGLLGVLTPEEVERWDAEVREQREEEERAEELKTLARLKAKYEKGGPA